MEFFNSHGILQQLSRKQGHKAYTLCKIHIDKQGGPKSFRIDNAFPLVHSPRS